ncbi:spermidine synthase [Cupriavidus sp.]|uniref:spermidine synthase n=1 Tax=Cupriavidus sp. TaxID=1873897 RepID=UPI003D114438
MPSRPLALEAAETHGALLAALLFASGASALVYQVLWVKQVALIVGVDVYAVTTGVSAFFLGLACGGWALGRRADRAARPLMFYAALELGIAVLGLGATLGLAQAAPWFVAIESRAGLLAWCLPFALIGVPALLMGGTLPALMAACAPPAGKVARTGGGLYAANTLGAMAGALLTTFMLVPSFGVRGAAMAAALVNLALAATAFGFGRASAPRAIDAAAAAPVAAPQARARLAVGLYAVAGGIALGYEVVWSQTIVQFMSTRSFAFTIVLATYLGGLVAGSAIYARFADRVRDPWGVFGVLVGLAGLVALLQVAGLGNWLVQLQVSLAGVVMAVTGSELAAMCARFALAGLCVVFAPTMLLGAAFPAALRLCAEPGHIGRDVGVVLALNTMGGIAGTFLTGFVLVPALGLVHTLGILAAAAATVGTVAVLRGPGVRPALCAAALGIGVCVAVAAVLTPPDRLARLLAEAKDGTLVSYEESPGGTVAVIEQGRPGASFRRLYISGVSNSGDAIGSLRYMRLQALLPLLVHTQEPRSALVVALGTGITAGALTQYPGLERRVTAELLPSVVRAVPEFQGNYDVSRHPGSDIRVRDGRHELLRSTERYDLITLEPPPPSAAGVVNLYSRDFYELARSRLQPGGLFAQWLPLATQNDEDSRALVRSFLDAFPHASLWTTEVHEMLLVGSDAPLDLDAARIQARFNQPAVAGALREVGINSPAALLATWVTGREGLERYAAGAPAVTDDRPLIEYAGWVRRDEISRVLPALLDLHVAPPLRGAGPAFLADIDRERGWLMHFYAATLAAYAGDRQRWREEIGLAVQGGEANQYFRRMLGMRD